MLTSSFSRTEPRSHYFILTNKKLNRLNNTLWMQKRGVDTGEERQMGEAGAQAYQSKTHEQKCQEPVVQGKKSEL